MGVTWKFERVDEKEKGKKRREYVMNETGGRMGDNFLNFGSS